MQTLLIAAISAAIGLAAGAALAWLALARSARAEAAALAAKIEDAERRNREEIERRSRAEEAASRAAEQDAELTGLRSRLEALAAERARIEAQLEASRAAAEEHRAFVDQAQGRLADAFAALSGEALARNNQSFLTLAEGTLKTANQEAAKELELRRQSIESMVAPVGKTLEKIDQSIQSFAQERAKEHGDLRGQIQSLRESGERLRGDTGKLMEALRTPNVRGRWGEVQLRRVAELAGMLEHCDFTEQGSVGAEGARLRPDLIVRLPGNKTVVIDAKAPLAAYLDALDAPDEAARKARLAAHAKQVREHAKALANKSYWEQFEAAPEFVVLFLPGENFFSAAWESDPGMFESTIEQRVILASPTTLIALLRAVAYGWQQERLAENARDIQALGQELYRRLSDLAEKFGNVGTHLGRAVESYNQAVGTLEGRVLPGARRFRELGAGGADEIGRPAQIEKSPRLIQAPELVRLPEVEVE